MKKTKICLRVICTVLILILSGIPSYVSAIEPKFNPLEFSANGCIAETDEELEAARAPDSAVQAEGALPASVDLTQKFPRPGYQGKSESCVAWATAYALKTYQENVKNNWGVSSSSTQFSPAFVYNQINGGIDLGCKISDAMKLISNHGVCTLADMPYNASDYKTQPNATQRAKAKQYIGMGYSTIYGVNAVKTFLSRGEGVVVRVEIYPDFDNLNANNSIFDSLAGKSRGGHAICLIGYDDSKQAFKFINSWGTGYGIASNGVKGYGYISYSVFNNSKCSSGVGYVMKDDRSESLLAGDFNGDGRDDLYQLVNTGTYSMDVQVALSTGSSFGAWKSWGSSPAFDAKRVIGRTAAGDFNGDGKDDIVLMYYYPDGRTKILVQLSTGSGFTGATWRSWDAGNYNADLVTDRFTVGDYNGDGKDDLAVMYNYPNQGPKVFVFLSTGNGFTDSVWKSYPQGAFDANRVSGRFTSGDVNGDGKDDITMMYDYGNAKTKVVVYLSTGSSFEDKIWKSWESFDARCVTNRFQTADVTGDGKADLVVMYYYPDYRTNIYIYQSTGSGFDDGHNWRAWPAGAYSADRVTRRFTCGKFNSDTIYDIAIQYPYADNTGLADNLKTFVFISTGNEINDSVWGSRNLFSYV